MELNRAYESLGLSWGASAQDVEAAYERLRADYDARIERASTGVIRRRYQEARAELDGAYAVARAAATSGADTLFLDEDEGEGIERALSILGLRSGASPLDVASAYVALCEELERDLASAPTDGLRRRCLESRAEVDEAYRRCAAALQDPVSAPIPPTDDGSYETQVSSDVFEPEPQPVAVSADEGIVVADDGGFEDVPPSARRRRGRGLGRAALVVFAVFALVGGAAAGFVWWTDMDLVQQLRRLAPEPPDPEVVERRGAAEYLRRRIAEEREDLHARAEATRQRVTGLESQLATALPAERELIEAELVQARARMAIAVDLSELTERHVFDASELAVAYGRIERGNELLVSLDERDALEAFAEAETRLEAALVRLDVAELAVGARSEAAAARDAWHELHASGVASEPDAARSGHETFVNAEALLEAGAFSEAAPELQRAAQLYRVALDEGRRALAAAQDAGAMLAEGTAEEASVEAESDDAELVEAAPGSASAPAAAPAAEIAEAEAVAAPLPDVAARPPVAEIVERAAIKLVEIRGGDFYYGCDESRDPTCFDDEKPGRSISLPAFRIDRTEVRVDDYAACVRIGRCTQPDSGSGCNWEVGDRSDHPVNCVDWEQAAAYCAFVGKRLPTEREWEKAARGDDGRRYPWGDATPSCANTVMRDGADEGCAAGATWPVGSLAEGRSPFGLFDMAGNVLEWTADRHDVGDGARVARGGSWRSDEGAVRITHRQAVEPSQRDASLGFRCATTETLAGAGR